MGDTEKKNRAYCRITDFLEDHDPEIATLLHHTCAEGALTSMRGKAGVTFLLPIDKSVRKEITDLAYSPDPDDLSKACDILYAHIIIDSYKSLDDWRMKQDDVPNALRPSQHIPVKEVGREVVFASKATAALDPRFKDGSRKKNLSVWLLKGKIPVTSDSPAQLKYVKRNAKGRKEIAGSYEPGVLGSRLRHKIALAAENEYELCRMRGMDNDPFCNYVLSLIQFLLDRCESDSRMRAILREKVIPLYCRQKLDFYLIFEPHRDTTDYIIDDELLAEWWAQRAKSVDPARVNKHIDSMLLSGDSAKGANDSCAIYSAENRKRLLSVIDSIRQDLLDNRRPVELLDSIYEVYRELSEQNTIGGVSSVFPRSLSVLYRAEPVLKLVHDALRYRAWGEFCILDKSWDHGKFNYLITLIANCLHAGDEAARESSMLLINRNLVKMLIQPTELFDDLRTFVKSTCFMQIPLSTEEILDYPIKNIITRPAPNELKVYNIDKLNLLRHRRLLMGEGSSIPPTPGDKEALKELLDKLTSISPASEELRSAIALVKSKLE